MLMETGAVYSPHSEVIVPVSRSKIYSKIYLALHIAVPFRRVSKDKESASRYESRPIVSETNERNPVDQKEKQRSFTEKPNT